MSPAGRSPVERRTGSLRRKFLLVVMASTCAALLLSAAALMTYEIRTYRSAWVSDLRSQADLVAQTVAATLAFDDPKAAREALAVLKLRSQIQVAAVFGPDGRLFASYDRGLGKDHTPPTLPALNGTRFDGDDLELSQPIERDGEVLGTVYVRARHDVAGRIVDYLLILAVSGLGGLLMAALIFRKLHPAITRPILAMADVSRRVIEDHDYSLRVTETSDDEVGLLVDAFNNMLRDHSVEMTERHRAEEALRQADRRKDEFLATLAHELRNPLAPIANALEIMKRADDKPEVRKRNVALMERQLAQMVRLIDDLLEVSRITRGKLELRRETVNLADIVRGALEAAEPMLQKKHHALSIELPTPPAWVDADAARLQQVFVNLLNNAGKYTDPHGRIRLSMTLSDDGAVVSVNDNGIGIETGQQAAVFDMFMQVDRSLERGAAGLGVGLTIARQLIQMHGGRLWVDSPGLGQGSTFSVSLPLVAAPAASLAATGAGAAAGSAIEVLIADDNVDFASSFGSLLTIEGHAVRVVHDGLAAWEAARAQAPAVAFLDIGMPGLNGYQLAERLRGDAATRSIYLVAVTGWGQDADRERVKAAGFDEHLVKPAAVQEAMALLSRRAAEPAV